VEKTQKTGRRKTIRKMARGPTRLLGYGIIFHTQVRNINTIYIC
jgi:hypothetical protein